MGRLRYSWRSNDEGKKFYRVYVELPKTLQGIDMFGFIYDDRMSFRTAAFFLACAPAHYLAQELGDGSILGEDTAQYMFRNRGSKWEVRFGGKETEAPLNNLEGMKYIHFLIAHRGEEFTAWDLQGKAENPNVPTPTSIYEMEFKEFTQLAKKQSRNTIYGKSFMKLLFKIVKIYEDKIADATEDGNLDLIEELQGRKSKVEQAMRKKEYMDKQVEKARKAIRKNIKDAINHIRKYLPALAEHLDDHLKPGSALQQCYDPKKVTQIDWIL